MYYFRLSNFVFDIFSTSDHQHVMKMPRHWGIGKTFPMAIFLGKSAIDFLTDHHRRHISVNKKRKSDGVFECADEARRLVPTRREVKTPKPIYPSNCQIVSKKSAPMKQPCFGT